MLFSEKCFVEFGLNFAHAPFVWESLGLYVVKSIAVETKRLVTGRWFYRRFLFLSVGITKKQNETMPQIVNDVYVIETYKVWD